MYQLNLSKNGTFFYKCEKWFPYINVGNSHFCVIMEKFILNTGTQAAYIVFIIWKKALESD